MLSVSLLLTLRHFLCGAMHAPVTDLEIFFCDDECPYYCPWDIAVLSLSLLLTLRPCGTKHVPVADLETFLYSAKCVPVISLHC